MAQEDGNAQEADNSSPNPPLEETEAGEATRPTSHLEAAFEQHLDAAFEAGFDQDTTLLIPQGRAEIHEALNQALRLTIELALMQPDKFSPYFGSEGKAPGYEGLAHITSRLVAAANTAADDLKNVIEERGSLLSKLALEASSATAAELLEAVGSVGLSRPVLKHLLGLRSPPNDWLSQEDAQLILHACAQAIRRDSRRGRVKKVTAAALASAAECGALLQAPKEWSSWIADCLWEDRLSEEDVDASLLDRALLPAERGLLGAKPIAEWSRNLMRDSDLRSVLRLVLQTHREPLRDALAARWPPGSERQREAFLVHEVRVIFDLKTELNSDLAGLIALAAALEGQEDRLGIWFEPLAAGRHEALRGISVTVAAWVRHTRSRHDHLAARGAELHALEKALASPEEWTELLPFMLAREDLLALVHPITVRLSQQPVVRRTVELLARKGDSDVSHRARAVLGLADGVGGIEIDGIIASRLAADIDAHALFPRPLQLSSSTWLSEIAVEEELRRQAQRAVLGFLSSRGQQFGAEEEVLVASLLTRLEGAFEERPGLLRSEAQRPSLTVKHRVHTKKEEKGTGVDVAILVEVQVHGFLEIQSAVAVQAKKAVKNSRGAFEDAWDVKVQQLKDVLEHFPSAVYLLLHPTLGVLVVPAKFLLGNVRAKGALDAKSCRVQHLDVRSAAIPFEQFLVDLAVGLWIGEPGETALATARGSNPNLLPTLMVDVKLTWDPGPDRERQK